MNKISILLLSSLLFLGGCTIGNNEDDFSQDIPPIPPAQEPQDDGEDFDVPVAVGTVGGIIPSTDPETRLRQIEDGRSDPFALPTGPRVTIQTVPQEIENGATTQPDGTAPGTVPPGGTPPGAMAPDGAPLPPGTTLPDGTIVGPGGIPLPPGSTVGPDGTIIGPDGVPIAPGEVAPPPPPPPTFAERILISGVMDVNGQNVAIISTPEGGSTRTVRVGESLMGTDGMVMVRAININPAEGQSVRLKEGLYFVERNLGALEGTVIFEEMGKRVTRQVGQPARVTEAQS